MAPLKQEHINLIFVKSLLAQKGKDSLINLTYEILCKTMSQIFITKQKEWTQYLYQRHVYI